MGNRLRASSTANIETVWNRHWIPFCTLHNLEEFISSGNAKRGGIMASFVVTLGLAGLVYGTITNYVWAVVDQHKANHYASPLANVRDWSLFMKSVQVECHEPSEPRLMVPWPVLTKVVKECNMDDMDEVATVSFVLILLFTGSRPELLPKTVAKFLVDKNLRAQDMKFESAHESIAEKIFSLFMRGTKADPLSLRSVARGKEGGAWRPIGNTTSRLFSVVLWMNRYKIFREQFDNGDDTPMFVDKNGHALTYSKCMAVFRRIQHRVNTDWMYSLGGIRSTFYVAVSTLFGSEHARALGMWAGDACTLYDRDWMQRTMSIPGKMAQLACSDQMPKGGLLEQLAERMQVEGVNGNPIISVAKGARDKAGTSSDEVFVIDRILNERSQGRKHEFLVKWQDYPVAEATWEPSSTFTGACAVVLQEYRDTGLRFQVATDASASVQVVRTGKRKAPLAACCKGTANCVRGFEPHSTCHFVLN